VFQDYIEAAAAAAPAISVEGGRILGSVGAGGIATALTVGMIAGIREPKAHAQTGGPPGAAAGKKAKIRKKLSSSQAQWMGITAGTFYMAAGAFWTTGAQLSQAYAQVITGGGFGTAGLGAASLVLASIFYFRELPPGVAAFTGVIAAGVWAQAGGVWGIPQALILTGAGALGIT
jgi:hypothetical protein